jgi:hypothetical protein
MTIRVLKFRQSFVSGKAVDEVLVAPAGEAHVKTQTWHRVDFVRPKGDMNDNVRNPDAHVAMHARWSVIGPAYEAWKSGNEIPQDGTPLAAWSGVSADQADVLKRMLIRTVEDVRDMSESTFTKLPFPNARQLPKLAADWLNGAKDAKVAQENADLKERIAAMEEMLNAAAADKPKRGRPAKSEAA